MVFVVAGIHRKKKPSRVANGMAVLKVVSQPFGGSAFIQSGVPFCEVGGLCFKEGIGRIQDFDGHDFVAAGNGVHDFLTLGDFAENGVLPVEVGRG